MSFNSSNSLTSSQFLSRTYQSIVFAGGGNRCWWQGGVLEALSQRRCWQPARFIGASAGASIATAFATGRIKDSLAQGMVRFDAIARNVEWRNLLKGQRPFVLSHIFPEWINSFLDDSDLARLKRAPLKIEVAITRPISFLPVAVSTALALALYSTEKFWLKSFHARLPHRLGFRSEQFDLAQSVDLNAARNLLLASGAAVPLTPSFQIEGRAALDGGFYDSMPLSTCRTHDPGTLVLLTRHRSDLPQVFEHEQRVYLQPLKPVAAINMDCTSGRNIKLTYDQGLREAADLVNGRA
ncbi:patatin-like phospholipase family protein [Variovorax sp. H27-G14]|uniref:patatin-like phospholipase family protein n=1 Tax=Variovorax sp. H27-G14 TaxID=3111914 RepID=UPI0038FCC330